MRTRPTRTRSSWLVVGLSALVAMFTAGAATAQTPFVPYHGKNLIHYNNFKWQIYTTDHFEIYFYSETEQHLERVVAYAESAYQQISADLRHDLAFKVPMLLFKTHAEFEQQNVLPGVAQEGVGAFAESVRNRMVLPMDDPPDLLYRLIVHELTHIFEFDIIPQGLIRRSVPLWVNEGLSDYETGIWQPIDLMMVRDAAVSDIVPKMTDLEGYGNSGNPRLIYNLGHAVFEFIESRWGKEGIRQFLFALRKSVIGGGESAYEEAFQLKAEDFDQQFDKYLKDRFKPFRDKERPADYGKNLAPNAEKTRFQNVFSAEPSPSGDLIAAMTVNRKDQEADIILISSKDGQIVRTLTPGFDQDLGFSHIIIPGSRWNTVAWMSWAPAGDRLAYIVRGERERALVLQNVITRKISERINLSDVDEPESPNVGPDGRKVTFSGLRGAVGDIFVVDVETKQVENVTNDDFADYAPVFAPDGKSIIYLARISGNEKLFRVDLDTKKKTQLTFGTHDDSGARFLDADTVVFSSTATDPNMALDADVARNGNIYNIWTLNLKNGELKQYTDALGGNLSPFVLKDGKTTKIGFVAYYKGEYSLHSLDRKDPIVATNTSDFGAPGPIIDFQAPLTHTLLPQNKKKKGTFEKLFVDGRPPVNVGITSGGDVFGGSQISFSDVLGDQRFSMYAASVQQYRSLAFSYLNLSRRLQWALQGFSQTQFFYGQLEGLLYDPYYSGIIDRDLAVATRTIRGGSVFAIYPFSRYRRVELSGAVAQYNEEFGNPDVQAVSQCYQVGGPECVDGNGRPLPTLGLDQPLLRNGTFIPLGVALVQETTVFREFGPLAGNTVRLGYEVSPKIGNTLGRQTLDVDARYYLRLGGSGLLALRARGLKSWGDAPDFLYFGGNSEMRGYDYLSFLGSNAYFANAELRFPLIEAMLTPAGVIGGIRGVFFFNIGGAGFDNSSYKFSSSKAELVPTVAGYNAFTGAPIPGPNAPISGFRLVDGRASYGLGIETFALGFPIHFDWAYRTLFNKQWEDILFNLDGGSSAFRKAKFQFWIGYDF